MIPDLRKLMKQMKTQELKVKEIVMRFDGKEWVFKNPTVMKMELMGQTTFQVLGSYEEKVPIKEEDVKLVMEKTGKSREEVMKALEESKDIAEAILKLSE
ncbi:MAG: nascent polypeptide-associated complex protein [Nanoarchaeota archaeon]|nr:nascent polypeptide-associated complex protein [Nanoarchaeota archaeon]